MITFPVAVETFIADQEKRVGRKFDDFQRELLGEYVELFNLEFDAGVKGLDPINIAKSTAEFYMKITSRCSAISSKACAIFTTTLYVASFMVSLSPLLFVLRILWKSWK